MLSFLGANTCATIPARQLDGLPVSLKYSHTSGSGRPMFGGGQPSTGSVCWDRNSLTRGCSPLVGTRPQGSGRTGNPGTLIITTRAFKRNNQILPAAPAGPTSKCVSTLSERCCAHSPPSNNPVKKMSMQALRVGMLSPKEWFILLAFFPFDASMMSSDALGGAVAAGLISGPGLIDRSM